MNFKYKCYLQKVLSKIHNGDRLNYLFQKFVTRNLPVSDSQFLAKIDIVMKHYHNFLEYNELKTDTGKYYEFGAGWDLIIPLSMSMLGLEVNCIDIRKLVKPELIINTITRLKSRKNHIPFKYKEIKSDTLIKRKILTHLKDDFHLSYHAPIDARNTNFDNDTFDFISSTSTLEHIPKEDIPLILNECFRILKNGGIFSMIIDYQDHWSYFDYNISVYNFLQFSSKQWARYNPSLNYQNRLRHPDYLHLIENTDFKIVTDIPIQPSAEDFEILKKLKINEEYKDYDLNYLGIRGSEIVLVK